MVPGGSDGVQAVQVMLKVSLVSQESQKSSRVPGISKDPGRLSAFFRVVPMFESNGSGRIQESPSS